jgi:hypothetical protein
MSEAMVVEQLIEDYWAIQGYLTKTRVPFKTSQNGWSDIDVLAYDIEHAHLVIGEAKFQGRKNKVYAYTSETKEEYGSFIDYLGDTNYLTFLDRYTDFTKSDIYKKFRIKILLLCLYLIVILQMI